MNYRQWKKKYKKEHGYNPPLSEDKRQQVKAVRKALSNYNQINYKDAYEIFARALESAAIAFGKFVIQLGESLTNAGNRIVASYKNNNEC